MQREVGRLREEMEAGDRATRVLLEAVRDEVRAVAEGVTMVNEKLDRRIGAVEAVVRDQE